MPIDTRIPLMGQPLQLENPLNQLAKFETIRAAQRSNALSNMRMQKYETDLANRNKLRSYLTSADVSTPEGKRGLLQFGEEGIATGKALGEQEKATATSKKTETEAIEGRLNLTRKFLDTVNTPDQAVEWLKMSYADPVLGEYLSSVGASPEKSIADLTQAAQTPDGFQQWKMNAAAGTEKLMEHQRVLRGQDVTMRGQDITAETQRRGQDITKYGYDLTDSREWWKARNAQRKTDLANDPDFQARLAKAKAIGQAAGKNQVVAETELPKAMDEVTRGLQLIDEMVGSVDGTVPPHPGFQGAVGATWLPGSRFVPGTDESDFSARFDQIQGSAFLEAFEKLRGGGQITEIEGKKATSAINRMGLAQSEKEFIDAARDLQAIAAQGLERTKKKIGTLKSTASPGTVGVGLNAPVGGQGLPSNVDIPPPVPGGGTELMRDVPAPVPEGIDPSIWGEMTEQERALWQ